MEWRVFDDCWIFQLLWCTKSRGSRHKVHISIGSLTKCSITWLLHTFSPWFCSISFTPFNHLCLSSDFWHFDPCLASDKQFTPVNSVHDCWGFVGQENPFSFTFQSPAHLQFPWLLPVIVWVISLREKHHYRPDLLENYHVLTSIWNQNFIKPVLRALGLSRGF